MADMREYAGSGIGARVADIEARVRVLEQQQPAVTSLAEAVARINHTLAGLDKTMGSINERVIVHGAKLAMIEDEARHSRDIAWRVVFAIGGPVLGAMAVGAMWAFFYFKSAQ